MVKDEKWQNLEGGSWLANADCFEVMKSIGEKSVDLILCDMPYKMTAHKWDVGEFSLERLWDEYRRVIKGTGVVCLFATQPFTTDLIQSNRGWWRYNWVWVKNSPTGFLNSAYAPLKLTEDVCVFSPATVGSLSKNPIRYYPQGAIETNVQKRNNPNSKFRSLWGYSTGGNALNSDKEYVSKRANLPSNLLCYSRDREALHPTQKPVALCEYLVKTYTKEGETVLDNCMGSGSTGVACIRSGRCFLGIERDAGYFVKARERLERECGIRNQGKEHRDGI